VRLWSRITQSLRLPAYADASSPPIRGSFYLVCYRKAFTEDSAAFAMFRAMPRKMSRWIG